MVLFVSPVADANALTTNGDLQFAEGTMGRRRQGSRWWDSNHRTCRRWSRSASLLRVRRRTRACTSAPLPWRQRPHLHSQKSRRTKCSHPRRWHRRCSHPKDSGADSLPLLACRSSSGDSRWARPSNSIARWCCHSTGSTWGRRIGFVPTCRSRRPSNRYRGLRRARGRRSTMRIRGPRPARTTPSEASQRELRTG